MKVWLVTHFLGDGINRVWVCKNRDAANSLLKQLTGEDEAEFDRFGEYFVCSGHDEYFLNEEEVIG